MLLMIMKLVVPVFTEVHTCTTRVILLWIKWKRETMFFFLNRNLRLSLVESPFFNPLVQHLLDSIGCEVWQVQQCWWFGFQCDRQQRGSWLSFDEARWDLQPHSWSVSWAAARHITACCPNKQGQFQMASWADWTVPSQARTNRPPLSP